MQLGGEKEMIEQAQVGALQIARISVGAMGPVVDDLNVFNLPFVFRDEAHMRKVIDGPIGQELLEKLSAIARQSRLIVLGWMDAGTRNVYANKPVTKPADLKGLKIRMMGNPMFVETMNAMGGNGVAMGFNELYQRAADRRGRRRGEQPADAARAEPLPGQQGLQPDRPPDHSRDLRVLEAHLGHAVQGRPGAAEEALARGADRAAQALGRERRRGRRRSSRPPASSSSPADKKAFYEATQPVRDKYGAKYAALIKRIQDTK